MIHKFEHIKQRKQAFAKYLDDQRATKEDIVEIEAVTPVVVDDAKSDEKASEIVPEVLEEAKASEIVPEVMEEAVDVEKLKKAIEWHKNKLLKNCFAQMNYDNLVKIKKDE